MYKVDIFTDKLQYASFAMVDGAQNIELDYLAYDAYTIETKLIDCKKGYFVHITEDNEFVCDGIVSDVKPDKATQQISIKPLQSMFDEEVFYSPVEDAPAWLATNIKNTYLNNADTYQNKPINLTYETSSTKYPLTGFNLHETVNILSVMISALKTHGVVTDCSLDLPNKKILVNIFKGTDTIHIRADLENVIESSVTLGDSYGSKNKAEIQKTKTVDDETTYHGVTNFYLHPDGSIDSSNTNRIWPVFRSIENLQQDDDMTDADWTNAALARAKEILEPQKYDNEIMLTYSKNDKLIHPNDISIGTEAVIYLKGNTYASVLTGKRIKGNEITLIFGVVRTEFTKKLSIEEREKMTFQNTVSAIMANVAEEYVPNIEYRTGSIGSQTGYVKVCRIKVLKAYANAPIYFEIMQRSIGIIKLEIRFANDNSVDPAVSLFHYFSDLESQRYFLYKASTSAWDLYVQTTGTYDNISIIRTINPPYNSDHVEITYTNEFISTALSWTYTAVAFKPYRIGDVIITSSNTNPSSYFGGTWELIDKEFTPTAWVTRTVSLNTTNCSACAVLSQHHGHTIELRITPTTKVALTDSTINIATFTPANFGVSNWGGQERYWTEFSDAGHGFINWSFTSAGLLRSMDAWTISTSAAHTLPAQALSMFNVTLLIPTGSMLDSWCNKFYWKRTA